VPATWKEKLSSLIFVIVADGMSCPVTTVPTFKRATGVVVGSEKGFSRDERGTAQNDGDYKTLSRHHCL
jgi:16S rRNA U1498 N3-methylase RsmE